jgi:hypothetical protein
MFFLLFHDFLHLPSNLSFHLSSHVLSQRVKAEVAWQMKEVMKKKKELGCHP